MRFEGFCLSLRLPHPARKVNRCDNPEPLLLKPPQGFPLTLPHSFKKFGQHPFALLIIDAVAIFPEGGRTGKIFYSWHKVGLSAKWK
jgi:hypothetical protein